MCDLIFLDFSFLTWKTKYNPYLAHTAKKRNQWNTDRESMLWYLWLVVHCEHFHARTGLTTEHYGRTLEGPTHYFLGLWGLRIQETAIWRQCTGRLEEFQGAWRMHCFLRLVHRRSTGPERTRKDVVRNSAWFHGHGISSWIQPESSATYMCWAKAHILFFSFSLDQAYISLFTYTFT